MQYHINMFLWQNISLNLCWYDLITSYYRLTWKKKMVLSKRWIHVHIGSVKHYVQIIQKKKIFWALWSSIACLPDLKESLIYAFGKEKFQFQRTISLNDIHVDNITYFIAHLYCSTTQVIIRFIILLMNSLMRLLTGRMLNYMYRE